MSGEVFDFEDFEKDEKYFDTWFIILSGCGLLCLFIICIGCLYTIFKKKPEDVTKV